jgi:putative chitinase
MSEIIKKLQQKVGSYSDGIFGPNTLKQAKNCYGLTNTQAAHFFAQCSHETGEFRHFEENLMYSKESLLAVFSKYFSQKEAEIFEYHPKKIANRVYSNRMGNGSEKSGDGYKYRGRGAIQLTGFYNYDSFSEYIDDQEVIENPDLILQNYSFKVALYYFNRENLWDFTDDTSLENIKEITRRINGWYNGLEHRKELTYEYYEMLNS